MDPTNPTPLPRRNDFPTGPLHDAYECCLCLELCVQEVPDAELERNPDTLPGSPLAARILGYLLLEIPAPTGKDMLAKEVIGCATDEELRLLAQLYLHYFVLAFKRNEAEITPAPSDHSSRRSFDEQRQMYQDALEQNTLDHGTAKAQAFIRDNYRCPFTGRYDVRICLDGVLSYRDAATRGMRLRSTNAAHIIPESTNKGMMERKSSNYKHGWPSSVWAVLARFSNDPDLACGLNGQGIHRLENIITVAAEIHHAFNFLQMWLDLTDVPNEYRPRSIFNDIMVQDMLNPVVFTSADPGLPVPSPAYIALHAACARVANLSGAAEYVDSMQREKEETRVLSTDGSSSALLSFALAQVV